LDAVKTLLALGAKPDLQTKAGETPLHWGCSSEAALQQVEEVVKLLLGTHSPLISSELGRRPLDCATSPSVRSLVEQAVAKHNETQAVAEAEALTGMQEAAKEGDRASSVKAT
ncbi:unnamed protein product, partial [Chrysoparadoxa australica]